MNALLLAKTIDHALLQPSLHDRQFDEGCEVAVRFDVAAVCVKSIDVRRAFKRVDNSNVAVCAVVGFPHGNATAHVVGVEAVAALQEGAREIDVVLPLSAALSGRLGEVAEYIGTVNEAVTRQGGILKVILETGLIRDDALKIQLCEICVRAKVAFVKTSTGFAVGPWTSSGTGTGTGPGSGTALQTLGATEEDVRLMVQHARPQCQVKASGGIRTLAQVERYLALGATRIGTAATAEILGQVS